MSLDYVIWVLKHKQHQINKFMKRADKSNSYPEGMILASLEQAIAILRDAGKENRDKNTYR